MIQPYAKGHNIATGNSMARHFLGTNSNMREWWKYMISRKGWITSLKQLNRHPEGKPVYAYINLNRWIAYCECNSCEIVTPSDPYFFCTNCMNSQLDKLGQARPPRPIVFPEEWQKIEFVLMKRPNPQNRNWELEETLDDLIKENINHDLEYS